MLKNDMIAKNDFISIEVGAKKYDVSNSGNHLFICENDCTRITQTTSIVEELKNKMVEVWLLSSEPNKYKKAIEAQPFSEKVIQGILDDVDSRYGLIEASNSRNYKQHNANCQDKYIPLFVLVIDGIDKVAGDIKYGSFFENLECLVMKSRAAGIQVVALINDLTAENKKLYARFSPPINVLRNGFFMKDATNLIMNTFARKGYYPKISISNDEGIRIIISIEIADHPIFFSYDYDDRALTYALNFSYEGELAMDKHLEILRMFDSDESKCFDSFQDDYYNGYLSLMGRRWDFDITVEFIEQIIDEISRLNVIKKLNEISHNEV